MVGTAVALMVVLSEPALCGAVGSGRAGVSPQNPNRAQLLNDMYWAEVQALRYSTVVLGAPEKHPDGPSLESTHTPSLQMACAVVVDSNIEQWRSVLHWIVSRSIATLHAPIKNNMANNDTHRT
jgi:hypothetical protein